MWRLERGEQPAAAPLAVLDATAPDAAPGR
jgi:hypothetical protein